MFRVYCFSYIYYYYDPRHRENPRYQRHPQTSDVHESSRQVAGVAFFEVFLATAWVRELVGDVQTDPGRVEADRCHKDCGGQRIDVQRGSVSRLRDTQQNMTDLWTSIWGTWHWKICHLWMILLPVYPSELVIFNCALKSPEGTNCPISNMGMKT